MVSLEILEPNNVETGKAMTMFPRMFTDPQYGPQICHLYKLQLKRNLIGSLSNGKKKNKKKANSAKSTDRGVEVPGAHLQAALGSIPVKGVKQKATDEEYPNVGNAKKLKPNSAEGQSNFLGPVGTIWDSVNWSCTYDALFTILYCIWTTNPHKWN